MSNEHPNIALLSKIELLDLSASSQYFTEEFAWHCINSNLSEVQSLNIYIKWFYVCVVLPRTALGTWTAAGINQLLQIGDLSAQDKIQ